MATTISKSAMTDAWYDRAGNPVKLSSLGLGTVPLIQDKATGSYMIEGRQGQTYTTLTPSWLARAKFGLNDAPNDFNLPENYTIGTTPTYDAPTVDAIPEYDQSYTKLPTYTAPEYDEGAITTLTQQRAAPGLRALRQQINRASGVNYENANVKRMTLRDALAGYGQGVASVINAAGTAATNEYNAKYSRQSENAATEFQSEAASVSSENQYQGDLSKTRYQGKLTEWQAKENAKREAAQMEFTADLERYKAENDISKTKFVTAADYAKTKYSKYMDYYTQLMKP